VLKTTLRGLAAHKVRLLLTGISIVLGVGFVSGTFVLSDTLHHTFDQLFGQAFSGVDLSVRGAANIRAGDSGPTRNPVPDSLQQQVAAVPGVQAAEGDVRGYAQFLDKKGKPIQPQAPTFGASVHKFKQLSSFKIATGRDPVRDGEVTVDRGTATKYGFHVGDRVTILFQGPPEQFTVVGITKFGKVDNLAGATFAGFELKTAQRVLNRVGLYDTIDVVAKPGADKIALQSQVEHALPPGYETVTGKQLADENTSDVNKGLGVITTALSAFGFIALFVGAFLIFNTFSILVAQRTRELGLLRALGASRRQVTGSVMIEALIVGLLGGVLGLLAGFGMASGLRALFDGFGVTLPPGGLVLKVGTVIVSVLMGVIVTTVAAIGPARRAGRIPPIVAISEGSGAETGPLRRRTVVGAVITGIGVVALLGGLAGAGLPLVGLGAMLTFIGVAVAAPVIVRPLASFLGSPLPRLRGLPGRLAKENAIRNPRRTAATAAALMIGMGLVANMTVVGASVSKSAKSVIDKSLTADLIVGTKQFQPYSPTVPAQLQTLPEVRQVGAFYSGEFRVNGSTHGLEAADPNTIGAILNIRMKSGQLSALANDQLLVSQTQAVAHNYKVGDTLDVEFVRTGKQTMRIGGIYEPNQLAGYFLSSSDFFGRNFVDQVPFVTGVKLAPGVSKAAGQAAIRKVLAPYPNLEVRTQAEYKADLGKQVSQLLGIVTVLLALAVLIALLGIANTLYLSIYERTRELGLLRAVGMQRRQVRTMVRWESVTVALIGTLLGLVVGIGFGIALVHTLAKSGFNELAIPVPTLIEIVIVGGLAGLVAASRPARKAAKLDVLEAIAAT
jgi:putative ABC transport system permease protein